MTFFKRYPKTFIMLYKLLITIGAASLICSCGTLYETQVTRFHQLPSKGAGESFSVSAPSKADGLETQQHLSHLASGLVEHGWVQTNSESATYKVAIDYGIGDGRTVHGVAPIYGRTGGGTTTYHSGTASAYGSYGGYAAGSYSGTSYTPATYGIVGAVPTTQTVFDRYLLVSIVDGKGQTVMEGKCSSSGSSSNLSDVAPRMIDSFLTDFPGESGKTKAYKKR
jgi:hypothetical protein